MPKIIVSRNTEWANKWKTIRIYSNGNNLGKLEHDQIIAYEVPPGTYVLNAKIDWCQSNKLEVSLKNEDIINLEIKGFVFSKFLLPLGVLVLLIYILIHAITGHDSLILATILMFFLGYFLFFVTIGRKQYLRLQFR